MAHFLIIDARFYTELSDELVRGAVAALEKAGATYDRISVPGALEIPAVIAFAIAGTGPRYDGYVALGCVIRGETTHYDIVSNESARALMDLAVQRNVAIGNGILTVENDDQALRRARVAEGNKGGGAAEAALAMADLRRRFGLAKGTP